MKCLGFPLSSFAIYCPDGAFSFILYLFGVCTRLLSALRVQSAPAGSGARALYAAAGLGKLSSLPGRALADGDGEELLAGGV